METLWNIKNQFKTWNWCFSAHGSSMLNHHNQPNGTARLSVGIYLLEKHWTFTDPNIWCWTLGKPKKVFRLDDELWVGGVKSPKHRFCVTDGEDVMIGCLTPKMSRDLKRSWVNWGNEVAEVVKEVVWLAMVLRISVVLGEGARFQERLRESRILFWSK